MEGNIMLILPAVFPILMGVIVLAGGNHMKNRKVLIGLVLAGLAGTAVLTLAALAGGKSAAMSGEALAGNGSAAMTGAILSGGAGSLKLWQLTEHTAIAFQADGVSRLFAVLTVSMWLLAGIYSVSYMTHEEDEHRFFGFYLIVLGVLLALDFSANLITFYVFYELMTLTSLPLVLHERTKEAVMAGLKYLFYSVAGAFFALYGIFFLTTVCGDLTFQPGGIFTQEIVAGKEGLFLAAICCMIVGFGTKAGMFPLHGWLPAAHPVAPAPASAVLSGVITKSGVLALIRAVYYIAGPDLIRGTWVQYVWILLSLLTVFMGSMLAYKEPVMKKRLAYSTVSQVSYVLFGLSLLEPTAFTGALSHVVFHSMIKDGLFLAAGAIIFRTGWTRVSQMRGLGKIMPVTLGCYTLVSLALVGIPPASGFISKWYLAQGALASGTGAFSWIGPAVLLVSALLTAGYLLPLTIDGFFPGADFDDGELRARNLIGKEPDLWMLVPIVILAAGAVLFGCFPGPLLAMLGEIAGAVL